MASCQERVLQCKHDVFYESKHHMLYLLYLPIKKDGTHQFVRLQKTPSNFLLLTSDKTEIKPIVI